MKVAVLGAGVVGVEFDNRRNGIHYYFRSAESLRAADRHMQIRRDTGWRSRPSTAWSSLSR